MTGISQESFSHLVFKFQENLDPELVESNPELHQLYTKVTTHDGTELFYNQFSGYLVREKPLTSSLPLGGILADEMGLGKFCHDHYYYSKKASTLTIQFRILLLLSNRGTYQFLTHAEKIEIVVFPFTIKNHMFATFQWFQYPSRLATTFSI